MIDCYFQDVNGQIHRDGDKPAWIVYYKQQIHGHKAEWRDGWFENTFLPWEPGKEDVHPTNVDFWTPEEIGRGTRKVLKKLCGDHPYWDLDLIMPTGSLANG